MHPDVAKLVEAGRIPRPVGERLSQLAPGNFCIHKSFGAGKVTDWDLPAKKVTIDFEKSTGQTMELQFAFQKTEWIPAEDFRAKKIEQLEELRTLSKSDPIALVVHLLQSHGGSMTGDALEKELSGAVIPEPTFKKWWDATKKTLRESRLAAVPQKRTEAIVLRTGDRSPAQSLVADFEAARDIKGMIRALEAIAADIGAFENDSDALKRLLSDIDEGAKKAARVQLGQALQLVAARDEVISSSKALELESSAVRLSDLLLSADPSRLAEEAGTLPSSRQRAVYEAFPNAFGDIWVSKIVKVFDSVGARGVTEIARILLERDAMPALVTHLRSAIARRALGPDALIWVCRERKGPAAEIFSADVGASVLNLLENDHLSDGPRKTSRLQSLLGDDKTLLTDLVAIMDINETRNFARRLLDCPVFGELEKKSLMARIIKARPETAELVNGSNQKRPDEVLLVSWESLEKKKTELDDIVRNKIPQNREDVKIAKSYGDLRENFEYKSAKDMEKYLGFRRTALEKEIANSRGTDFKGSDAGRINIGTIVTLADAAGAETEITVLGAWDSIPETKTVSYLSEVGKALVGRAPGETVQVRDEETEQMQTLTVRSIRPFNP
ncbi:GreA/GreB family elongation factor [Luteolibacter yonseiensis]|uniref:GreA/GreB family elongation factor n=1 Tax=Luteolibacter yonseiensis TaxID=1144680 RepID=A0A934RAS6_9BACT|nr:GreA/GreB family elongation factor [Luteolibacter yonseiensis]MBK1818305.1 GreA/GreB family elongation factor [Luteolibacter yonseiensis]